MKLFRKAIYGIASIVEVITETETQEDKYERFSDGIGGYIVNGESMSREEIEIHDFTTGMYDDY